MTAPIYPKAIASWSDRIDGTNTIFAADPNMLAAEIVAIETALGVTPNIEPWSPGGTTIYGTVSDRISDAMLSTQHPFCEVTATNFNVPYGDWFWGTFNSYKPTIDNFGYYNGSDITIKYDGVYSVSVFQRWQNHTDGVLMHNLQLSGSLADTAVWKWADPPTAPPGAAKTNNATRQAITTTHHIGALGAGTRIRVGSVNMTGKNPYAVEESILRVYYHRALTGPQIHVLGQ